MTIDIWYLLDANFVYSTVSRSCVHVWQHSNVQFVHHNRTINVNRDDETDSELSNLSSSSASTNRSHGSSTSQGSTNSRGTSSSISRISSKGSSSRTASQREHRAAARYGEPSKLLCLFFFNHHRGSIINNSMIKKQSIGIFPLTFDL